MRPLNVASPSSITLHPPAATARQILLWHDCEALTLRVPPTSRIGLALLAMMYDLRNQQVSKRKQLNHRINPYSFAELVDGLD